MQIRNKSIIFRVTETEQRQLRQLSAVMDVPMSDLIREAVMPEAQRVSLYAKIKRERSQNVDFGGSAIKF